jgi:pimeloyl-ACP methyl ester carboxylesterase
VKRFCLTLLTAALVFAPSSQAADDTSSSGAPVTAVADHTLHVHTARGGDGLLPLYVSTDWSKPHPEITRAILIFHGKLRNADTYNASGLKAIAFAGVAGKGTLLITPQFLAPVDTDKFHLPPSVLRWAPEAWMGGEDAIGQAVSSFDAIDAILLHLADRALLPNLKSVVLAGHSGGGQVMQRYAVAGRAGDRLLEAGIHVRYVVANPSSYVYFSPSRPDLDSKEAFTFGIPKKSCMGHYNNWKYGIQNPPPYVGDDSFSALEQHFLHRDVIYLLGTQDIDPNHPALDKTCSAEDEGPYRFFRGKAYFAYLETRHPELMQASASQQLWYVPGVEHDGDKMFTSPCGLAALFNAGACPTRMLEPKP